VQREHQHAVSGEPAHTFHLDQLGSRGGVVESPQPLEVEPAVGQPHRQVVQADGSASCARGSSPSERLAWMWSSFRLGRLAGIEFGVNWSWLVVFALIVWTLASGICLCTKRRDRLPVALVGREHGAKKSARASNSRASARSPVMIAPSVPATANWRIPTRLAAGNAAPLWTIAPAPMRLPVPTVAPWKIMTLVAR
jgi:hypothetical protein